MEWIADPQIWVSLLTLTALEVVLGIDNIIFISILAGKLPPDQQDKARKVGLMLAMVMRIVMLMGISWLLGLTAPLFTLPVLNHAISGKDLILLVGGLFLVGKSVFEIHEKLEGEDGHATSQMKSVTFNAVVAQILVLDVVFSLDSVITAVGMADVIWVMVAAVVIALSFLILIGVMLVGEAFGHHIPKGYIYFAMAFAFGVEMLNLKMRTKKRAEYPVELNQPYR
jgi:predicted tellurium resistance membrane protein TerC